jgi:hypothetical protein
MAKFSQSLQIPAKGGIQTPPVEANQFLRRQRRVASIQGDGAPMRTKLSYQAVVVQI